MKALKYLLKKMANFQNLRSICLITKFLLFIIRKLFVYLINLFKTTIMTHNELRAKLLELYPDSDNSELKLKNTELRLRNLSYRYSLRQLTR